MHSKVCSMDLADIESAFAALPAAPHDAPAMVEAINSQMKWLKWVEWVLSVSGASCFGVVVVYIFGANHLLVFSS